MENSKKFSVHEIYGVEIKEGEIDINQLRVKMSEQYNAMVKTYAKEAIELGLDDDYSETNEPKRLYQTESEMQKIKALIGLFCSLQMPDVLNFDFVSIDALFEDDDDDYDDDDYDDEDNDDDFLALGSF